MGTSSNSLSSPITFTGQSTFSSSFQQVLQRAVSIASLPMQQLEGEVSKLQNQQSDLNNMQQTFNSLTSALQAVSSAMTGEVTASSSNDAIVTATAQSATLPGSYTIQVSDVGSSTTSISAAGSPPVTDPSSTNISSSTSYTLTVNGIATTIAPANKTLNSLAESINNANAGVSATVVNLGSNSSPDYRLSLTSTELGADTIQLSDSSANPLLTTVQSGTDAQYTVNGNSTVLSSTSDQVTLAPGLTATLVSADPGVNITITVAASEANLANALSSFATAYNSAAAAVAQETGQNGGALAGQSLVYELQHALSQIGNFSSPGNASIPDISSLGLSLSSNGALNFDAVQFDSLSSSDIQQFLGGLTTGGFLQSANNVLATISDPSNGMLVTQYANVGAQVTNDQSQISSDQARVNLIQTNLSAQLSAADAAIAVLQEQSNYLSTMLQTENANNIAGLG